MQESNKLSSTTTDTTAPVTGATDTASSDATTVATTAATTDTTAEEIVSSTPDTSTTATATATADSVAATAPVAPAAAASKTKKIWQSPVVRQYGIAFLIVAAMGIALWYLLEEQGRVQTGFFDDIKSLVMPEPAAVLVNGEKMPMALYQKNYDQLLMQAASQGADVNDPAVGEQVKKEAVDVLINSALLKQAAAAAGVVVKEEDVTARYNGIVESQGGEEGLAARMAELNITKEALMQDINDEILIQTHINNTVDLTSIVVTPEEIDALYASVSSNPAIDLPPLDEVRPQIEGEIRFGKEQELIGAYIETLKKDAQIEILI